MIFRKENYHNKLVYIQNEFIENQNGLNFNSNFEGGNLLKGRDKKIISANEIIWQIFGVQYNNFEISMKSILESE